jgi:hypothetical protein
MFSFTCSGHINLLGTHKTTLEFTKENHLTKQGDCIIGVSADFDASALQRFVLDSPKKVFCRLEAGGHTDSFSFILNRDFCHPEEIVIRKTDFLSDRTLGIFSRKAAIDIDRNLISSLSDPTTKCTVTFHEEKNT